MGKRYNGLLDSERLALTALRYKMQIKALEKPDSLPSPEACLKEVVNEAELSHSQIVDERKILTAFNRVR